MELADIHVAIVTFSPQTPMIKEVLKQRFPDIVDKVGTQDTCNRFIIPHHKLIDRALILRDMVLVYSPACFTITMRTR